jgi:hypothetical protein
MARTVRERGVAAICTVMMDSLNGLRGDLKTTAEQLLSNVITRAGRENSS